MSGDRGSRAEPVIPEVLRKAERMSYGSDMWSLGNFSKKQVGDRRRRTYRMRKQPVLCQKREKKDYFWYDLIDDCDFGREAPNLIKLPLRGTCWKQNRSR